MSDALDTRKPIVTRVTGECVRGGPCERCGAHVRRHKVIAARSLEELDAKIEAWEDAPLLHARCEQIILAEGV